ncbi:MAG: hypothetical protein A2284_10430 [Deltaproteobacteria bacterium RIFOXYA12_FULL_61_11]|nr:MAG: hypothetical protein A2284_10430 [Deltaproteobacteria bacterium RIFOXYA12_FULL_61_11]
MARDPYAFQAPYFDLLLEPFNAGLRALALRLAGPGTGRKMFEVGCGTGSNLALFRRAGYTVTGLDASPAMLGQAVRKLGDEAELTLGNAAALPYPSAAFELGLAMLTLHELPGEIRVAALAELDRVVRPGGTILLVDFHPRPYSFPLGWLARLVILCFECAAGLDHLRHQQQYQLAGGLAPLVAGLPAVEVVERKLVTFGTIELVLLKKPENGET